MATAVFYNFFAIVKAMPAVYILFGDLLVINWSKKKSRFRFWLKFQEKFKMKRKFITKNGSFDLTFEANKGQGPCISLEK